MSFTEGKRVLKHTGADSSQAGTLRSGMIRKDLPWVTACAKPNKTRSKAVELKEHKLLDSAHTPVLGAAYSDGLTSGVCADFMIF